MKSRTALIAALVGTAYYFGAKLGLVLSTPPDYIATFWPPNTVILAALILTDRRRWWIWFLAMTPAYVTAALQAGYPVQRTIIFYIANCTEILVIALALKLFFRNRFKLDQLRAMIMFLLFAVLIAPAVSAFMASTTTFAEPSVNYWLAWRVWFLGDAIGHLTLTPVIILWISSDLGWIKEISFSRMTEVFGLVLCLFIVGFFSLGVEVGDLGNFAVLLYTPLPILLWAAIRFGPRGICSAVFIITLLAIWNAINGRGPFTTNTPADNVLSLQLFLVSISIPTMMLGFILSERKEMVSELEESELRLREMAENITSVFWMEDIDRNLLYTSPAYEQIWGRTCKSFYENPRSWLDAIHPDDRQRVADSFSKWKFKGEYIETFRIIRSNGEIRWIYDRGYPILNTEGEVYRIAGIAEDITGRKQIEEALFQSEKLKSLGIITAGISHEFNNILNIISGKVELLEMDYSDNSKLKDELSTIMKAVDDGATITDNMLKITKSSDSTSVFIPSDLNELIKQSIEFTKPRWKNMAQANGIDYIIDQKGVGNVSQLLCNPTEIREVFTNIISNALDAMPDGGRISFCAWSKEETFFVSISDTGKGMDKEVKNRIFDPFFTTRCPEGTGLGMSMAYGIITRHGGKIEVESEMGKGSTFTLQFPTTNKKVSPTATPGPEQETTEKNLRILVIDDEEDLCEILNKFLSRKGYNVKTVDNGADAINIIKVEDFDLVLCDLAMSDVYGYDVIKAINKSGKTPTIGIMTGWGDKLKPIDDEDYKVDFILRKPFKHAELAKHINELFGAGSK